MNIVTLKAFRATDIEFINHHDSGVRIEFENTYSYNVKYTPDNNCIGEFTLEVKDRSAPDKFRIKAVIVGSFGYDPSVKKEKIHIESFRELFPYARAMVSSLTVNAGLPPVMIPSFDIESQSIYKFGKNC